MAGDLYPDKRIVRLLDKLNACYPEDFQWTCKRAIKAHTDLFDEEIRAGLRQSQNP
jgi:hypothetical protein